jgi:RNA-binding protein YlmH
MACSSEPSRRGYIPPQTDDERLLQRRIAELVKAAECSGLARTTAFLNDREQELALAALHRQRWEQYVLWGGREAAERKLLCVYGGDVPPDTFAAQCIRIEPQKPARALTHRDYLGAILSLGIKRECVGDILVNADTPYADVMVLDTVAPLLLQELREVGRCTVRVSAAALPTASAAAGEEKQASVSSLRLDALLAAMLHCSRTQAASLIKSGAVEINHVETSCVHADVYADDVFSVRGYGKYKLCSVGKQSKKGRTFVSYLQY